MQTAFAKTSYLHMKSWELLDMTNVKYKCWITPPHHDYVYHLTHKDNPNDSDKTKKI